MWTCAKCGEKIEDQFDSCWKCAGQADGSGSRPVQRLDAPTMRRRYLILAFVTCLAFLAPYVPYGFRRLHTHSPLPTARFLCLTNFPASHGSLSGSGSIASFARFSITNAVLVQTWLNAGTNTAVFVVSNSFARAIDIFPFARLATAQNKVGGGQHTPLLLRAGQGMALGPGESRLVPVALIPPHAGAYRIQFTYHVFPTDDGLLKNVFSRITGTAPPGSTGSINSDWVNQ